MRLFIATTFPADVLRDLNDRVTALRPRLPSASWVRPESQHLTFAFLGEQPESLVETISPALERACATTKKFEARIRGCGFFPNSRRARVGWAGLLPEEPFRAIATTVRAIVSQSGVKLDGSDFKPHLTLLRVRDPWPPASIDLFTRSFSDYESVPFSVAAVTLFSSRLDPKGAVHTPQAVFPLHADA